MLLEALGVEDKKKHFWLLVFCIDETCKRTETKYFGHRRKKNHEPQAFYRNAFKIAFDGISDCLLVVQRRHISNCTLKTYCIIR